MGWKNSREKVRLRHLLRWVRALKTWQLVVLLLLFSLGAATLLRMNSLGMIERRSAVLAADEKGDMVKLKSSLVDLQTYVSRHMNTSMGNGFFLTKTYERDRDAALASAGDATNPSSSVYQQASIECRERWKGGVASFRNDYVQCVIERVSALSPAGDAAAIKLPKADNYKITYASPLWSPDLAGFVVAICVLIVVVIVGRMVMILVLRAMLRRHYQST